MTLAVALDHWGGLTVGRLNNKQGYYLVLGWLQVVAAQGNMMLANANMNVTIARLKQSRRIIPGKRLLVYLSGPYSGDIDGNIARARKVAIELWEKGYAVICPHLNTSHFHSDCKASYEDYLAGDFIMVERSDAILMLPGWRESQGARRELRRAGECGVPVYEYPQLPQLPEEVK